MATVSIFIPLAAPFNLTSFLIFSDSFFFWSKLLELQCWEFWCFVFFCSSKNAESEHTEYNHAKQNRAWAPFTTKIRVFSSLVASPISCFNKQLVIVSKNFISASHPVVTFEVYLCFLLSCSVTGTALIYIFQCQHRTLIYRCIGIPYSCQ